MVILSRAIRLSGMVRTRVGVMARAIRVISSSQQETHAS